MSETRAAYGGEGMTTDSTADEAAEVERLARVGYGALQRGYQEYTDEELGRMWAWATREGGETDYHRIARAVRDDLLASRRAADVAREGSLRTRIIEALHGPHPSTVDADDNIEDCFLPACQRVLAALDTAMPVLAAGEDV